MVDNDGHARASLRMGAIERLTEGRFTSLPRGDLATAVYATLENEVETLFGDSIAAIEEHADRVDVRLERGGRRDFDLLIGADGLHSNVRHLAFGPEADYARFLNCRVAACVLQGYRPRQELTYVIHNEPGRQVGRFTLRGDRTLCLFVFRSDDNRDVDGLEARKAMLRRAFAGMHWECPRMLAALDDVDELYFDVVSQIRMPRWSQGRVALIGDAAGCISLLGGEGTGLAMTEAYVLAGELQRAGGDWQRAFAAYEARMRPFIEAKQRSARRLIGFFATRTRTGIWLRDQALRLMSTDVAARLAVGRGLRDDFELPDY